MTTKVFTFILVGLLLNLSFLNATALANSKEDKLTVKVKNGINKLGIGKDSKVKVRLKDNTQIKGYISKITESDFTIIEETTNSEKLVAFPKVKQVKGNNLSKGAKIAIGIGIVVAVIAVLAFFSLDENER